MASDAEAELERRHERELSAVIAQVPWAPPGLATDDHSAAGRAAALIAWAQRHPGQEADAITSTLLPVLLAQRAESPETGAPGAE